MSTEENKALVKRLFQAWDARDFETAGSLFAPDYVNHNPPPMPGVGGDREGQLKAMRILADAFPDAKIDTVSLTAEGDRIVAHDLVRGTHRGDFLGVAPTGREVTIEFIHIFRIADGQIAERWGLIDAMSLLGQLGALPEPVGAANA